MAWFILGVLVLAFYGFIAYAPSEVIQLVLVASWVLLALSAIIFPLIAWIR